MKFLLSEMEPLEGVSSRRIGSEGCFEGLLCQVCQD